MTSTFVVHTINLCGFDVNIFDVHFYYVLVPKDCRRTYGKVTVQRALAGI